MLVSNKNALQFLTHQSNYEGSIITYRLGIAIIRRKKKKTILLLFILAC